MALVPPPVSRIVLIAAFCSVASSAGLQWLGLSARAEATRQRLSRESLAEFAALLQRFEDAPAPEKTQAASRLTGAAERLSQQVKGEALASASRRVVALASFESPTQIRDKELQERLRAEIRSLTSEAELLESTAAGRVHWLNSANQWLWVCSLSLFGLLLFRRQKISIL